MLWTHDPWSPDLAAFALGRQSLLVLSGYFHLVKVFISPAGRLWMDQLVESVGKTGRNVLVHLSQVIKVDLLPWSMNVVITRVYDEKGLLPGFRSR